MSKLLVSIITVAYNSEKTIARTIESVLRQTYSPIEYIIIDGVSKDNTVRIAETYLEKLPIGKSLKIISEPDKGMYDALNKGVRMARGMLIGNINSDDWYEPNAVACMVSLYKRERYDLAWADLRIHNGDRIIIKKAKVGKIWTTNHFCHPTMFGTKECEMSFPYALKQMDADFDMVLRVHMAGYKITTIEEILANYCMGGMSTQKSIKKMIERIKMKYRTYRRNGLSRLYIINSVITEVGKYLLA